MKAKWVVSGVLMGVAGVLFAVGGVLTWRAAQDQSAAVERSYRRADVLCRESVQKLGEIVELRDGAQWDVRLRAVSDSRTMLANASVAVVACPTRTMEYFCMGPGCFDDPAKPSPAVRRPVAMDMRLALKDYVPPDAAAPAPARPPGQAQPTSQVVPPKQPVGPPRPVVPAPPR